MEELHTKQLERMEEIGKRLEQKRIMNIVEEAFNHSFLQSKGEILINIINKILDRK